MLPKGENAVSIDFEDFSMDAHCVSDGNSAREEIIYDGKAVAAIFGLILARKISMDARSKKRPGAYVTDDSFLDGTHEKEAAVAKLGDGGEESQHKEMHQKDELLYVHGTQDPDLVDLPLYLLREHLDFFGRLLLHESINTGIRDANECGHLAQDGHHREVDFPAAVGH